MGLQDHHKDETKNLFERLVSVLTRYTGEDEHPFYDSPEVEAPEENDQHQNPHFNDVDPNEGLNLAQTETEPLLHQPDITDARR
jgi:hypothetical protein